MNTPLIAIRIRDGMQMPGRVFSSGSYRYGFNGQEKAKEIDANGNHNTALFGELDNRLGKRWNPDPKPSIGISYYSVFSNNPILKTDLLLDTPTVKQAALMAENSYSKFDPNNPIQAKLKEMGWDRVENVKTNILNGTNQEIPLGELGKVTGFNMALYRKVINGKSEWVLANAGTADLIDVGSDAGNIVGNSYQFSFSVRFAKSLQKNLGDEQLTFVGHSLGGGLAAANSLSTGNAAIIFNPAGISYMTRMNNNLPRDKRNGQIQSFVVAGEVVDRSQRLVGSVANGRTTYIHPELGQIDRLAAFVLRWSTDILTSVQYHMMSVVQGSLDKAGIK